MKGNVIRLNIMHLNSVHLNSIGEVQSVSLKAGESTEDPVYPPTTYTLAANVSNGKVTATKNGTAISLPYVATEGDVIVLSVTPDEGYEFNGWLDGNKSNPRTVTMTGNVVLSASCVEIAKPTYTLSASVTNGKVSAKRNGSAVNLPFTANEGDTIVLEVTPNDGYTFEGWNDGNTDNPRTITMNADVALSAECSEVVQPPVGKYIQFEDPAVEAICVANWSSDGIGLTEEDAAAVTTIGTTFRGNTEITSFDELNYFTGVTTLEAHAFNACSNLQHIGLDNIKVFRGTCLYNTSIKEFIAPNAETLSGSVCSSVSTLEKVLLGENTHSIDSYSIRINANLKTIICKATTPPSLGSGNFTSSPNLEGIYVPDASLEAYRTATNWVSFADRIHPLSEIEDYYIQDALLMHLDGINKGNVEGEWQDLVSGNTFVNHGAVAEADGWRFDGASSYMDSATLTNYGPGYNDRTIEVVAEFERENTTELVYMGGPYGYTFGRYAGGKKIIFCADDNFVSLADDMASGVRIVSLSSSGPLIVASKINGNDGQESETEQFTGSSKILYLGKRSTGSHFKGIIHSIRIHNRALSKEEILYNQRIDNKRFNLGLDI